MTLRPTDKHNGAHLYHGDCFRVMPSLPDHSVDLVFADIPYNMTSADWDKEQFDLKMMWEQLNRIVKPKRAMVFTAIFPFAADLVISNRSDFKSDWMWKKTGGPSGAMLANKKPMRWFENVLVFAHGGMPDYYPIKERRLRSEMHGAARRTKRTQYKSVGASYDSDKIRPPSDHTKHPSTILDAGFIGSNRGDPQDGVKESGQHPTQKPVSLISYLIRTYSQPGAVVLDFTMGSGSTGVAAIETGRDFIGIEMDDRHYATARDRIRDAKVAQETQIPGLQPQHQTELLK